jgi:hypothetical protein
MCAVVALAGTLVPSAADAAANAAPLQLAPAATVTSVAPTILAPSQTSNIVLTGTDFVAGTAFTASTAAFVINMATVDSSTQVTLNVTAPSSPILVALRGTPPGQATQTLAAIFVRGSEGTFFPVTPVRAADTRSGIGGRAVPLGANDSLNVTVTGIGEVPATTVAGVVLNVTATDSTNVSFITVYPTGAAFPAVSNLNFGPNQTIPNHVTVGVGTNGQITVYNEAGSVNVIVDVVGCSSAFTRLASEKRGGGCVKCCSP